MKEREKIIHFSKVNNEYKKKNANEHLTINPLKIKSEQNTKDVSNSEIDSTFKKIRQRIGGKNKQKIYENENKELKIKNYDDDITKNLKMMCAATLPGTINSSKRRVIYFPQDKKNSWFKNTIININVKKDNDNSNDSKNAKSEKCSKQLFINISTEPNKKKFDINSLLYNNKKITNLKSSIPFKKFEFKKRDSRNSKILSMDYYNAFQCIFCEQIFKETEISKLIICEHKFCNKCGEKFYDYQIKINHTNYFKCPLTKCKAEIPDNVIEFLFSSKNETYRESSIKQDDENTFRKLMNKDKEIKPKDDDDINIDKIDNDVNVVNKKYLLEVNKSKNNFLFYIQSHKNFALCPSCNQNTLYRNANKYFLKCLSCEKKYCKSCMKLLVENHFDQENAERCKVYFRNQKKKSQNVINFGFKFIRQIVLTIFGYLFIMSFFINKIKEFHKKENYYSNCGKFMIYLLYVILFILFLPLNIIIIPFYPVICCL
jgi:hypothetical protein